MLFRPSNYLSFRQRVARNRAQMSWYAIAVIVFLCVAYLSFPQDVNHFVHFLLHDLNGDLKNSFHKTATQTTTTSGPALPDFKTHK